MTLSDLIEQAKAQNPFFKRAIEYRIHGRKSPKPPDLEWLMPQLENILGREYVRAAAESHVEKLMKEANGNEVDQPKGSKAKSKKSKQTQP